ncbi:MAG: hypothetical protein ACLGGX_12160 [Bdellovibrionia bacterium]
MKISLIVITALFSLQSFAESTEDLSQILKDSNCVPVVDQDGSVSTYKCDGTLVEKMKEGKFQNLGTQRAKKMELNQGYLSTSTNGEVVESPANAMELYNSLNTTDTLTVQRPASLTDKIKSCLAGVYTSQISYHKAKGIYTSLSDEFGLNRISTCKGLNVSADYANQNGFKFVARSGDKIWSVDDTKTILEIRWFIYSK